MATLYSAKIIDERLNFNCGVQLGIKVACVYMFYGRQAQLILVLSIDRVDRHTMLKYYSG